VKYSRYDRELGNIRDRYAVAVKDRMIIGHLMRKVLCVCSLLLRRGGTVRCIVTGITTANISIDLKCIDCNKIIPVKIISCIKFSWFMTTMNFFTTKISRFMV